MVGFRFKGSVGSLGRCRGRGGGNCNKMSMKVRVNKYDKGQRFFGLKGFMTQAITPLTKSPKFRTYRCTIFFLSRDRIDFRKTQGKNGIRYHVAEFKDNYS